MEFNNDNAAVCPEPIDGSSGEIDLYDALTTFANSPAEKLRLVEVAEKPITETEAPEKEDQGLSTEPVLVSAAIKPPEPEETIAAAEFHGDGEPDLNTLAAPSEAYGELEWTRPSGPLDGLTNGFVFTGALSGGVCIACGTESGADELFCIACGVFIE